AFVTAKDPARARGLLAASSAAVILLPPALLDALPQGASAIATRQPRLAFARILTAMRDAARPRGIHPDATVDPAAKIDPSAYVGACAVVGRCEIGPASVVHAGCVLYDGVRIGARVTVHAGSVLGADGFGYERAEDGTMQKFPHIGGVIVEDDVEIGANACVDRGSLDDTAIRRGAKIDNLVHIAHNVEVGEDCVVIAHAMIGGSVRLGPRAWVAPSASILNGLEVGADAVVGLGAVVVKPVAAGAVVKGNPARPRDASPDGGAR
ncbi:MAG: hypothetical protein ING19_20200, partial [Azospirillum sp.]|nr:hypothetical protein [Azospirillum sp.]